MDPFLDPPNSQEIISKIQNLDTVEEFTSFINEIMPGWLIFITPNYSKDYPHLQGNWFRICRSLEIVAKKIVLVADIKFDTNHVLINFLCEYMTKKGYCVRKASDFVICPVCESVIPCKEMWEKLVEHGLPVPENWNNTCLECQ